MCNNFQEASIVVGRQGHKIQDSEVKIDKKWSGFTYDKSEAQVYFHKKIKGPENIPSSTYFSSLKKLFTFIG